jgi:trimethylamine--corrinoid protein Co-methyltransferase
VNDDTLALDTIQAVGQEGHFMGKKHTIDHAREMWQPMVTDGQPYKVWKTAGCKNAADHAREKAKEILKTHEVEPLAEDIKKELAEIVKEAEKNIPAK